MKLRLCLLFAIGIVFVGIAACGDDSTTTTQPQVRRAFTICRADIRSNSGTDDGAHADGNGHTDAGTDRSADCHSATAVHSNGCT